MGKRRHSPNSDLNSLHSDVSHGSSHHYPLKKTRGQIDLTNSEKRRRQTGTSQGKSMTQRRQGCPDCRRIKTSFDTILQKLESLERTLWIRTMNHLQPPPPPPPNFLICPQPTLRRPFITMDDLKKVKLRKTGLL